MGKKLTAVFFCLTLAFVSIFVPYSGAESLNSLAQAAGLLKAEALSTYLENIIHEKNISGSILVSNHGKILFDRGFGLANTATGEENTPSTKFLIGSLTKAFTAMSVMQLMEKGMLDLQDPIGEYLPGFPHGEEITVYQLLTHTSGLPSDISGIANIDKIPSSMEEALDMLKGKDIPLLCMPGTAFHYSNTGYVLLGFLIERITGISYGEYVRINIFEPLDMKDSGFGYDRNQTENLAVSYDREGRPLVGTAMDLSVWPQAAGGLYSTAEDLYKWDRALYGGKLLSKDSMAAMFTPHIGDNSGSGYGFGWGIYHTEGGINTIMDRICVMHGGSFCGFLSSITRFPDDDACIIHLGNQNDTQLSDAINQKIIKILFRPEVYGNGTLMAFEKEPVFIGKNLFLPAEEFALAMNFTYQWNDLDQDVTVEHGHTLAILPAITAYAAEKQKNTKLEAAVLISGVPYVPGEFVCETLGFSYAYDAGSCTVMIGENAKPDS